MNGLGYIDIGVLMCYLAVMLFVGVYYSRGSKTSEDYMLGGRRLPWWAIAISLMMALLSTISMVAIPGEVFSHGLTLPVLNIVLGTLFGIPAFFLFIRFYFRVKTFTPFEYLEQRFDVRVRLLGSLTFWMVRLVYLSLVLFASARIFEGASDSPVWLTILIVGVVGTAYTMMGGRKAVVRADVIQFAILAAGISLIIAKCVATVPGGFSGIIQHAAANNRGLTQVTEPGFYGVSPYVRVSLLALVLLNFLDRLYLCSSDQLAIQGLLSTSSYKQAMRSYFLCMGITVPVLLMLCLVGMSVYAYYGYKSMDTGIEGDLALFRFIASELPVPMSGLILAAMLAAAMSTLVSGMNALATVATKDLYVRHLSQEAGDANQVAFSKVVTLVVGALAVLLALAIAWASGRSSESLIEAGSIWLAFSCVLPPMYLAGVASTRVNARHVLSGALLGWGATAAAVAWYVMSKDSEASLSFVWVGIAGSVVMMGWCSLPVLLRCAPVSDEKIQGLTLWTLDRDIEPDPDAQGLLVVATEGSASTAS